MDPGRPLGTTLNTLFTAAEGGDPSAADALFAALYEQLHRLAQRQLARDASDLTLSTTTLLHEAYLDIAGREGTVFPDQGSFMAYAARVMRTLIIDHVRNRKAHKRGGLFELTSFAGEIADPAEESGKLEELRRALEHLRSCVGAEASTTRRALAQLDRLGSTSS